MSRTPVEPATKTAPPLPLTDPWLIAAALVAFGCILYTVTFRIIDSDFWQHLLVGRTLWERGAIPREHLWSWVTYGRPEVLPSWLFRWLLWPFYAGAGVEGLFAWRWLTTLLAFVLAWSAARRMGARGTLTLVVLVWCALVYRARSQVRPETLAAVFMMADVWLLERARRGRPHVLWWMVPLTWLWVNAHLSWFIGFVLLGVHALLARQSKPEGTDVPGFMQYMKVGLVMAVVAFVNPFGWQQLWQPFDYALHLSGETLFRGIGELQPVSASTGWRHGLWLMVVGWPVIALLRGRRRGMDGVELTICALATAYALPSQRFLGVYALLAAPYLARDLQDWADSRPWPSAMASAPVRAVVASAVCVLISIPEWRRPLLQPGIDVALERFPVAACDFIERTGIRGRGFEQFRFVGYQAWRFWPERDRLPFTDIHQSGSPEDRAAFAAAFTEPSTWPNLARQYQLDYVMLDRRQDSGVALSDEIDADTTWALVFLDDVAALYVRRQTLTGVARTQGLRHLGGGARQLTAVTFAATEDSTLRSELRAELNRAVRDSRWNATTHSMLANLAMIDNGVSEARAQLDSALAVDPRFPSAHYRLAMIDLFEGKPAEAIPQLKREQAISGSVPGLDLALGMAYQRQGDRARAREHYRAELRNDPGNAEARARLDSLSSGSP